VAKRNSGRRGASRKRRPGPHPQTREAAGTLAADVPDSARERRSASAAARPARRRRAPQAGAGSFAEQLTSLGDRPRAPWHPLPLSELLILVGLIGTVVGVARAGSGHPLLFAGLGAVVIGTLEFTVREHLSGYRSHTTLLAFLPTALFHSAAAVVLVALGAPAAVWAIVPLVLDAPVFVFLFRLLRIRFQDARRERILSGGG
jgi:hypothetical protein